jgi:hypothetical protein
MRLVIHSLADTGAPIFLNAGQLLYDGLLCGHPAIDAERAVLCVVGKKITIAGDGADHSGELLGALSERTRALQVAAAELEQLGVAATIGRDGLFIDGQCVARATDTTVPDIAALVGAYCLDAFEKRITSELNQLLPKPIQTSPDPAEGVIRLYDDTFAIGTVTATSARIGDVKISGSFIRPANRGILRRSDADWTRLAEAVVRHLAEHQTEQRERAEREAERVERAQQAQEGRRAAQARHVIDEPPKLPANLLELCLSASEDIRFHRTAAFSNPVTLITPSFELTFRPIDSHEIGLRACFSYKTATEAIEGELRLSDSRKPLPIIVHGAVGIDTVTIVWAAVLLGFAALTVLPEFVDRPPANRPHRQARRSTPRIPTATPRTAPRVRTRYHSATLVPTGWTATAHWVVGHVRILPDGNEASHEAEREAAQVGITLRAGETWVRPHVRGGSPDRTLTFRWQPPEPLVRGRPADEKNRDDRAVPEGSRSAPY